MNFLSLFGLIWSPNGSLKNIQNMIFDTKFHAESNAVSKKNSENLLKSRIIYFIRSNYIYSFRNLILLFHIFYNSYFQYIFWLFITMGFILKNFSEPTDFRKETRTSKIFKKHKWGNTLILNVNSIFAITPWIISYDFIRKRFGI